MIPVGEEVSVIFIKDDAINVSRKRQEQIYFLEVLLKIN